MPFGEIKKFPAGKSGKIAVGLFEQPRFIIGNGRIIGVKAVEFRVIGQTGSGNESCREKQLRRDEQGRAGKGRGAHIGRIIKERVGRAGRQELPVALAGGCQEVEEGIAGRTDIAYAEWGREGGDMSEDAACPLCILDS